MIARQTIAPQLIDLKKVVHFLFYALIRNGHSMPISGDTTLATNGYGTSFENFSNKVFTAAATFEGLPSFEFLVPDVMRLLHQHGETVDRHSCGFLMHLDALDPYDEVNQKDFINPKNFKFWDAWDALQAKWKHGDKQIGKFIARAEKQFPQAEAIFAQANHE